MITCLDKFRGSDKLVYQNATGVASDGVSHLEPPLSPEKNTIGSIEYFEKTSRVVRGGQTFFLNIRCFTEVLLSVGDRIRHKYGSIWYRIEAIVKRPDSLGSLYVYLVSEI
jgi:hypothetical protein